ncbi:MAG: pyridoxal phosphate-dependent aminotransferase [Leptospirillia bacterium]
MSAMGGFQPHGGDLRRVVRELSLAGEPLDFSVNTHPFGPPESALAAATAALSEIDRYPDPQAGALIDALAAAHGLPPRCLLAGNGATELIDLIPRALGLHRALQVTPTFSAYGEAVRRTGGRVIEVPRSSLAEFPTHAACEAIRRGDPELVTLCTPNNPTGDRIDDAALGAVLAACAQVGAYLLLDEAFVEYDPEGSRLGWLERHPRMMVLRGFTKFYALAGLRVGYLAAAPDVAGRLRAARPPWSVNRVAEAAAIACLADTEYPAREQARMTALREDFSRDLSGLGLKPLPSVAGYLLVELPDGASADRLFKALARDGFLIRHCGSFGLKENWLRLRVHRSEHNRAFVSALSRHL